ncbi:MAG TPA: hypothetical protein VFT87_04530 [Candidatus Saccharimonadales bacterium]|nr:hypothetical protein [Candidatus Saccharimonadales bacterium]
MLLQSTPNEPKSPLPNEPSSPPSDPPLPKRRSWLKNTLSIIFIGLSFFASWWIYTHGQELVDFVNYRLFTPSTEVIALADKTDMTSQARYIFYASDPKVDGKQAFNTHCHSGDEAHSVVLGCYRLQRIFVYNVTDQRLYGVKEVTAAHEMLHAVYERLPVDERLRVNQLIQSELIRLNNPRLHEIAELYSRENASIVWNEMHSILGTEYRSLSAELETHFKKYFNNRSKVVALTEAYEGVFNASKDRLKTLDERLETTKKQIDANYTQIDQLKKQLDQQAAQLDHLRTTDVAAYNAAVPGFNALVNTYNTLVVQTREAIHTYNVLIEQRNSEAATHNDLYKSLDSHIEVIQGT